MLTFLVENNVLHSNVQRFLVFYFTTTWHPPPPPSLPNVANLWQANGTPSWSSSRALRKEAPLPEIRLNFRWEDAICLIFPTKKMDPENHLPLEVENHLPSTSFFGVPTVSFWVCSKKHQPLCQSKYDLNSITPVFTGSFFGGELVCFTQLHEGGGPDPLPNHPVRTTKFFPTTCNSLSEYEVWTCQKRRSFVQIN